MWTWVWESFHLSHLWFPFRHFRCCVLFSSLPVHTHIIQFHARCTKYPLWDLMWQWACQTCLKHPWVLWSLLSIQCQRLAVWGHSIQFSCIHKTAFKSGRCGHHTVGPPVDRICWNVGADHHAQTMYFLSPLMKHHPTIHANHFLMSMRASK